MSVLTKEERDGLDDAFLSISTTRISPIMWSLSQYHSHWVLDTKKSLMSFYNKHLAFEKNKITLNWRFLQKNCQKVKKHRQI